MAVELLGAGLSLHPRHQRYLLCALLMASGLTLIVPITARTLLPLLESPGRADD